MVTAAALAVLLRQTQWMLDSVAHDLPAGRLDAERREALAGMLEALAVLVRDQPPAQPAVVEGESGS